MRRRKFIALVGGAILSAGTSLSVGAQAEGKVYRIGYLACSSRSVPQIDAFLQGLREVGYVEGQNIAIDYQLAIGSECNQLCRRLWTPFRSAVGHCGSPTR